MSLKRMAEIKKSTVSSKASTKKEAAAANIGSTVTIVSSMTSMDVAIVPTTSDFVAAGNATTPITFAAAILGSTTAVVIVAAVATVSTTICETGASVAGQKRSRVEVSSFVDLKQTQLVINMMR
jgi:hypothetical protein